MNYSKYTLALILLASSAMAASDFDSIWAMVQDGTINGAKAADLHLTEELLEKIKRPHVDRRDAQGILGYDVDDHAPRTGPKPDLEAVWAMVQDGSIKTANFDAIHVSEPQLQRLQLNGVDKAVVAAILGVSADSSIPAPVASSSGGGGGDDDTDSTPSDSAPAVISSASDVPSKVKPDAAIIKEFCDPDTNKVRDLDGLLKFVDFNSSQMAALSVPDLVLTDEAIEDILSLEVTESAPTVVSATVAAPSNEAPRKLKASAEMLLEYTDNNRKIKNLPKLLKKFELNSAQIAALSVADLVLTDEAIAQILSLTDKKVESVVKATDDSIDAKVEDLNSLVREGKIELTDALIAKHKLTEKQVSALKNSKVSLNSEEIKKILEAQPTTSKTPESELSGSDPDNSNNDDKSNQSGKGPWYTSTPVIAGGIVVALAAIGGGVYMMSGRNEQATDL